MHTRPGLAVVLVVPFACAALACASRSEPASAARPRTDESASGVRRAVLAKLLYARDDGVARLARAVMNGEANAQEQIAYDELAKNFGARGFIPGDWPERALAARARLAPAGEKPGHPGLKWVSLGPFHYTLSNLAGHLWSFPAQGRASAAWGDPRPGRRGHWIFGFSGGGVWETWNEGRQWKPLTDDQPSLNVGSIAVDASAQVIYVGTGEQVYIFTHPAPFGSVILKSQDGGKSWATQTVPWPASLPVRHRAIGRLVIDPAGPQKVWAATTAGLMRTVDGGATWTRVESPGLPHNDLDGCDPGVTTDATDIAIDTRVPTHGAPAPIYVAIGAPFYDTRCSPIWAARAGNGIYRSLDGGESFTRIASMGEGPFPALDCSQGFSRIVLALGPPDGDRSRLYALIGRAGGEGCGRAGYMGTFRTLDANAPAPTWTLRGSQDVCGGAACFFRMTGVVAPDDDDVLFLGGLELWRSTDGGAHMEMIGLGSPTDPDQLVSGIAEVHSDHHALTMPVPGLLLDPSDGGVFEIEGERGPLTISNRNRGHLSTLEFYGLGQHPTDPAIITGGAQDMAQPTTFDGKVWGDPICGGSETSTPLWNRTDPRIVYSTYGYGAIWQSTDGGRSYGECPDPFGPAPAGLLNYGGCVPTDGLRSCIPDGAAEILAPAALDPNNQDVLFDASAYLYSLVHPSPDNVDWTRYCAAGAGGACPDGSPPLTSGEDGEDISAIYISPAGGASCNQGVTSCAWLTGSNLGAIFRTTDGGASWQRIDQRDAGLTPARGVISILTHPDDQDLLLVGYGGFDADAGFAGQPIGHLFRSLDGGATWTDIGAGLPDVPVSALALDPVDPTQIYVATWLGVYRIRDAWGAAPVIENASFNLPNAMVFAMGFSPADGRLRVATHGRGIWELKKAAR